MIHIQPGVFLRFEPRAPEAPVVVDVSRSGREYPCEFRSPASFTDVHDNASMYVEEIYKDAPAAGATMLFACFPNTYIDANRGELDIDETLIEGQWPVPLRATDFSKRGLGLLKSVTRYGVKMHERNLTYAEVEERLDRYHRPYHRELKRIIDGMRQKHGRVWQLSCHCMSAIGAPTHVDPGQARPDICIGNMGGVSSSPEFLDFLAETAHGMGYSVNKNYPYKGGELNRRYGDPGNGVDSVLVELNKNLFMDIKTFRRTGGFSRVQSDMGRLVGKVVEYARARTAR